MIVGIDLGTTNTLASMLNREGSPVLIPDVSEYDNTITPSLVAIDTRKALVGYYAQQLQEVSTANNLVKYFKRNFGQFQPVYYDNDGNEWYAEGVAALVLRKVMHDAEMFGVEKIDNAVISVPAHYNDSQRKSVFEAAKLAGLPMAGIIEEPVAAAMHYFHTSHSPNDEIVMVYDLGGGTFDLTLVTKNNNSVYVIAKDGLSNLGGKEFDEAIATQILNQYETIYNSSPQLNPTQNHRLIGWAEKMKIELSSADKGYYSEWVGFDNNYFEFTLMKPVYESWCRSLVEKTDHIMQRCLRSIGLNVDQVNQVLLVGGSSQFPYIKKYFSEKYPHFSDKLKFHYPLQAVALGAGLYAGMLGSNGHKGLLPVDFKGASTYNTAIKVLNAPDNGWDKMIAKNTPLPVTSNRVIQWNRRMGDELKIQLAQYWDESDEIFVLGTIVAPLAKAGLDQATLELSIENKNNGTVGAKLKHVASGENVQVTLVPFKKGNATYNSETQGQLVSRTLVNNIV